MEHTRYLYYSKVVPNYLAVYPKKKYQVFASPTADAVLSAILAVTGNQGAL
jgi:hypothetical protein